MTTFSRKVRRLLKVSYFMTDNLPLLVYFLVRGEAAYVLPRFNNASYITLSIGDHFGHVDLANDREFLKNRLALRR